MKKNSNIKTKINFQKIFLIFLSFFLIFLIAILLILNMIHIIFLIQIVITSFIKNFFNNCIFINLIKKKKIKYFIIKI